MSCGLAVCRITYCLKFNSSMAICNIDDLNIPNCWNKLENIIYNDIYPPELDTVKTNSNNQCLTFLGFDIFIENKQFNTKLCTKRNENEAIF